MTVQKIHWSGTKITSRVRVFVQVVCLYIHILGVWSCLPKLVIDGMAYLGLDIWVWKLRIRWKVSWAQIPNLKTREITWNTLPVIGTFLCGYSCAGAGHAESGLFFLHFFPPLSEAPTILVVNWIPFTHKDPANGMRYGAMASWFQRNPLWSRFNLQIIQILLWR